MIRVLIADDEPLAREGLRDFLAEESDLEIVGEARDGPEAVRAIERLQPDLVLLDIRMPGLSGVEVLAQLEALPPAVIFVTAHDAWAVRAFELHAVDYLLKPVARARLREAIARARERIRGGRRAAGATMVTALGAVDRGNGPLHRFVVKSGGRIKLVRVEDVRYIEAAGNYARLHTAEGRHAVRETMQHLEDSLDPARFLRIHRSYLVNLDAVLEIRHRVKDDLAVHLRGGETLPLSRAFRARLEARLGERT